MVGTSKTAKNHSRGGDGNAGRGKKRGGRKKGRANKGSESSNIFYNTRYRMRYMIGKKSEKGLAEGDHKWIGKALRGTDS